LKVSDRVRTIAEYRATQDARIPAANPGYDVIVNLDRAHICRRRAREWGLVEGGSQTRAALRGLLGGTFSSNGLYHSDVLVPSWRQIGLGVVATRSRGLPALFVVEDFIAPC
jgi:hypothetical protein